MFSIFLARTANASEAHRQRISRHCHFPEFVGASFLKFQIAAWIDLAVTEYATEEKFLFPFSDSFV